MQHTRNTLINHAKVIIYPLCSEENKGIPPLRWQNADKLHNIRGHGGQLKIDDITYEVSDFYTKTTGRDNENS
jgi:hypothetical protein